MQNTVYECKQNGEDFFLSLSVTCSRFGNCPANGLVTEQPQYSVVVCIFSTWQNTEMPLISNGLRLIFTCSLSLALPCIFHLARHSCATCRKGGFPPERQPHTCRKCITASVASLILRWRSGMIQEVTSFAIPVSRAAHRKTSPI